MSVAFDIEAPKTGLRAAPAPAPAASHGDSPEQVHDHLEQATASLGGAHDTTAQLMSVGSGEHGRLPHRV